MLRQPGPRRDVSVQVCSDPKLAKQPFNSRPGIPDTYEHDETACRYQRSGNSGPAVLMVHGFGANADHWRKNTPGAAQAVCFASSSGTILAEC